MTEATKILVVDDNQALLDTLSIILKRKGFDVDIAGDGFKALERCHKETFDIVLMDIVMPGLNGFQATRQLTKDPETAGIPVIIVTTKDQETDRVWGKRQGAKDYLTKPVEEATLIKTLKSVLGN